MNAADVLLLQAESARQRDIYCSDGPVVIDGTNPFPDYFPIPQYRFVESARRGAMLAYHSTEEIRSAKTESARRRRQRGRLISVSLTVFIIAAVALCGLYGNRPVSHSAPGAASVLTNTAASGAPLTAENAPIVYPVKPVKAKRKAVK